MTKAKPKADFRPRASNEILGVMKDRDRRAAEAPESYTITGIKRAKVGEGETRKAYSFRFPEGLMSKLDAKAKAEGHSRTEILEHLIIEYLEHGK